MTGGTASGPGPPVILSRQHNERHASEETTMRHALVPTHLLQDARRRHRQADELEHQARADSPAATAAAVAT